VWAHSGLISHDPVDHGPASRVLSTSLRPSNRAVAGQHWRPSYTIRVLQLRSGDRLLLVTDGMVDRNAIRVDLSAEPTPTTHLHPRELVQYPDQARARRMRRPVA